MSDTYTFTEVTFRQSRRVLLHRARIQNNPCLANRRRRIHKDRARSKTKSMNKVFVAMSNQVEQNIMDKLKGLPLIPTPYSPVLADEDTEVIKIKGFDNDTAMNLWDEFANESDGWTTTMGYDDFEKAIKKANEIYNENN